MFTSLTLLQVRIEKKQFAQAPEPEELAPTASPSKTAKCVGNAKHVQRVPQIASNMGNLTSQMRHTGASHESRVPPHTPKTKKARTELCVQLCVTQHNSPVHHAMRQVSKLAWPSRAGWDPRQRVRVVLACGMFIPPDSAELTRKKGEGEIVLSAALSKTNQQGD